MTNPKNISKNDIGWNILFEKYKILECIERDGYFNISAAKINEVREARLMTKFDHSINLPNLFKKNKLSILPITRGSYIISCFEAYKKFETLTTSITKLSFPGNIESIDCENISSEASAINCAYISNMLTDFIGDGSRLMPTVGGRMSSEKFSFFINNITNNSRINVDVSNSQIEIDGAFEGKECLSLIEAKNDLSEDFLIRQLYYPFRLWNNKISKRIKPIFLVYSNGIFSLYEYDFEDICNYNSLRLIKHKNYSIDATDVKFEDIIYIHNNIKFVDEPKIPFPQADNFKRLINLCELLAKEEMTREEISTQYAFDPRQADYYTTAGRYLGLIDKKLKDGNIVYYLSESGYRILKAKYRVRQLKFVNLILGHRVFFEVFKRYLIEKEVPSREVITGIMKRSNLYNVNSEETFKRRASTVTGWIKWIIELYNK